MNPSIPHPHEFLPYLNPDRPLRGSTWSLYFAGHLSTEIYPVFIYPGGALSELFLLKDPFESTITSLSNQLNEVLLISKIRERTVR